MEFITRTRDWITIAEEAYKLTQLRKECERKEKELYDQLKSISQEQNSFGGGYRFSKIERKGTVDYSKIPELSQVDLNRYRKESSVSWQLEFTNLRYTV